MKVYRKLLTPYYQFDIFHAAYGWTTFQSEEGALSFAKEINADIVLYPWDFIGPLPPNNHKTTN